jgi:hypothetical protein
MRYATVRLSWTGTELHPVDELFAASDAVVVESIRYVGPVRDGRYVELIELRGDLRRARELLAESAAAVEFDVAGGSGRGVAYVQCRAAGLVEELLDVLHTHDPVVDWPVERVGDETRGLRVTVLGTGRAIGRAAADLPEPVRLRLERMGEYEPGSGAADLPAELTDRQREVLDAAVRMGYYETPRETTHREVAAELGVAVGTVTEHLQRVESRVIGDYVR